MNRPRPKPLCAEFLLVGLFGSGCGNTDATVAADTEAASTEATGAGSDAPSSAGADDSGEEADGTGTSDEECSLLGFESEPSSWALPEWPGTTAAFEGFAGSGSCDGQSDTPTFATFDLDTDGLPDLVVTTACGQGGVGNEHWLVFRNEGDGFGEATPWSLPDWPTGETPFPAPSNAGCATGDGPDYTVVDLDGDDTLELVVTQTCSDDDVGRARWLVFPNLGDGFGDAATWSLPDWPSAQTPFGALAQQELCDPSGGPTYALVDLTADNRPDLVVTSACLDGGIGDSQWLVFPNTGEGFGDALTWSLPAWPNAEFVFRSVSASRECDTDDSPSYGLADLDGDAALDLVVTQTCGNDSTGREQWLVFANEGNGFGEPQAWALPEWPAKTAPFPSLGAVGDCDVDSLPTYALTDLDVDDRPDLVVTFACESGGVGAQQWLVFPNDGNGFTDPQPFALPDWPGANDFPFDALGGPSSCSSNEPAFGLIDLTGEGKPALTLTFACGEAGLGSERWWRFERDCD